MAAARRFPRQARLLRPADFVRVYEQRRTAARGPLVVHAAAREAGVVQPRLGLSVSRRIGTAVVRNAWKRRLREAFRHVQAELPPGYDYIVVVRSGRPQPGADGARRTERLLVDLATRAAGRETKP